MADEPSLERELTGMETWFAVPGGQVLRSPPVWKMWLLSSTEIYPLITLLSVAFQWPFDLRSPRRSLGR
jgi:antibiotic biosynthesis monooxygenase (ABM) superfamily enzyme